MSTSSPFGFLQMFYGIQVNNVSDYLKLLKSASQFNPKDLYFALMAFREFFYSSPGYRFLPTYSEPVSSSVTDNVVVIEDKFFKYKYVVEDLQSPFIYLDSLEVKEKPRVEKFEFSIPGYLLSQSSFGSYLDQKKEPTPYEQYLKALLLVNGGTIPFTYVLPFPLSRRIEKVEYDKNVIRIYAGGEERDIIILDPDITKTPFAFGVFE